MYKLFIVAITVGGFVSASSCNNVANSNEDSSPLKSQYCLAEDTSDDDKLERSRRGKKNKGRRKGGNGLR